mmetsp:Transcript_11325/g.31554  ORF Transcript_11325/g.31554 Transcript_11325/m.31554 type:complete len:546 (-) Transcript_11325:263-1900(-)
MLRWLQPLMKLSVSLGDQEPFLDEHHRDNDCEVEVEVEVFDEESNGICTGPVRFHFSARKLWRFMGPGWLMSLAYLDPGNLEADLQQGAYTGFDIVWVLWWATVTGLILQELSARLGVVTGRDLAQNIRVCYPKWLTYIIYVNMELAVVAADIQEVVGSGIAIYILSQGRIPVWIGCILTGLDTFTFLAVHHLGVRYFESLICSLVVIMTGCFFFNWFDSGTDGTALAYGWLAPTMKSYAVTQAVGTVGAIIMPHNLYLHSGLVLSRKVDRENRHRVNDAINYNFIESAMALLVSFFINLAIVATNASNFYSPSCAEDPAGPFACLSQKAFDTSVAAGTMPCTMPSGGAGRCGAIGLQGEGLALKHGLGDYAMYVWAFGLLAAGQASTMTCTYAGQVIMGGFLQIHLAPWKRVALTRFLALGPSIFVAAVTVGDSALFNNINEYLNVWQSVQLPFAMLPVLHLASQSHLMGQFSSPSWVKRVHTMLALIVMGVNLVLVLQFVQFFSTGGKVASCLYGFVYLGLCLRIVWDDVTSFVVRLSSGDVF